MVVRKLLFEALEHGPYDVLAGLQDFMDVGVDFSLNIVVLPDVTIKRNIHSIDSRCLLGISLDKRAWRYYILNI
jgi:hypothetical protein